MARQSSAKASTAVRIRFRPPGPVKFYLGRPLFFDMRYFKWIGIASAVLLIIICFLPWTYHADIDKTFTGFFSEKNKYGRPGKYFVFFSLICVALFISGKVWAKRVQLFISGIIVAYAIKTYILYTSCYNAYCPEKKAGIYLMLICAVAILIASIFPQMTSPPTPFQRRGELGPHLNT